jgi:fatty-acyl-CoA synthase
MNFSRFVSVWAEQRPHSPAIHCEGTDIDYASLEAQVRRCAIALHQAGVRRADRVAWLGGNDPQMLILLFALARIGAIFAPLNFRLAQAEHASQLTDCAPALLIHEQAFADRVSALRAQLAGLRTAELETEWLPACEDCDIEDALRVPHDGLLEDDLLLVYTSGTSGEPKGVVLTQNALLWNCINSIHAHDLHRDDHVLMTLPLFHVGGLNIMLVPALYVGARVTLHRRFDPEHTLSDIESRKPTLTLLVPAMLSALLTHPRWASTDLSSLRMINTGSSVVPVSLLTPWMERGIPAAQVYGATETCPIAIYLRAEDTARKVGSAGRAAMHCEIRLTASDGSDVPRGQVGEIRVRGPNLMRCYFGRPEATAAAMQDGWYHTGDLARQDEEGFYWVVGRSKDMLVSGGENIYPAELESVLADCPLIAESTVVGLPDERWGEVPVAVIVRKPQVPLDTAGVLALFEGRLARFKFPKRIVFTDTLPKTALGKVQKDTVVRDLTDTR